MRQTRYELPSGSDGLATDDPGRRAHRSTEEVFADHLRLRAEGRVEEDIRRNFAEDVVLLTVNSRGRGHDAIRMSAERLKEQLPGARFEYKARRAEGRFALLIWTATSLEREAIDGADTFVIEDGLIRLQTIHYRLRQACC